MKRVILDRMKALVLSSGGIDSTTCLAMAVKKLGAKNVSALSIFYGQRHERELQSSIAVAEFYNVARYELDAAAIFKHSNSALLNTSTQMLDKSSYAAQINKNRSPRIATYVPFRNGLMLSMAASFADSIYENKYIELYIGVHADDASTGFAYADCRGDFVAAMSAARIHMPFRICRQYIARGSWSQQVAISSRLGSGCSMTPSGFNSASSSAPNLNLDVSIFADAPFDESHSS